MASYKTRTRTVRIKNECADYFADKPMNRAIESIYEGIMSGKMSLCEDGSVKILGGESVHTEDMGIPLAEVRELLSYARFYSLEDSDFLRMIMGFIEDGSLSYERGKIICRDLSMQTDEFKAVCKDMGKNPQDVLNEATKRIRRGWL